MSEYLPYIAAASIATILTRFLPYWLFKRTTENRALIYLQKNSGLVIMAILTIYSLKAVGFMPNLTGIFLVSCLILTFIIHKIWQNFLLSIAIPTILYMILLRLF